MRVFYERGVELYDALLEIGEFVLTTPRELFQTFNLVSLDVIGEWVNDMLNYDLYDKPIIALVMGAGLIFVLVWKIVSFVLDVVPG